MQGNERSKRVTPRRFPPLCSSNSGGALKLRNTSLARTLDRHMPYSEWDLVDERRGDLCGPFINCDRTPMATIKLQPTPILKWPVDAPISPFGLTRVFRSLGRGCSSILGIRGWKRVDVDAGQQSKSNLRLLECFQRKADLRSSKVCHIERGDSEVTKES
jgi:hypothetical protein